MSDTNTVTEKTTMTEKVTTETQKLFTTGVTELVTRWTQAAEEWAKVEARTAEQFRAAFTEYNRLANAQLDYALKLSAEMRTASLEAAKKAQSYTQQAA